MRSLQPILGSLLRGQALISLVLYLLPFAAAMVLGFVWLGQQGYFLHFVVATATVLGLARIPRLIAHIRRKRRAKEEAAPYAGPLVAGNPEWTETEARAYKAISATIAERLSEPVAWPQLSPMAFEVLDLAADKLSGGKRKALDFSVPEALLLADRILTRLRQDLRDTVPFSDTISLRTLFWLWQNRAWFQYGSSAASWMWRAKRMMTSPIVSIAQEVQNLIISGTTDTLKLVGSTTAQRVVLEEVARAAIDLHSGALRFTDAELLEIQLASDATDARSIAEPDVPLRLLLVGQVSAGKSSLVNALAAEDLTETDMAPTTDGLMRHDLTIGGMEFKVIDSQGLDGSRAAEDRMLSEMMQCDMILWVMRANRPARAPDAALLQRFEAALDTDPKRRRPPVIIALTAVDLLVPGWPFAEHDLPDAARTQLADMVAEIGREMDSRLVLPVSVEDPEWNLPLLESMLTTHAAEALMVQRNRRRLEGRARSSTAMAELRRGAGGVGRLAQLVRRGLVGGG